MVNHVCLPRAVKPLAIISRQVKGTSLSFIHFVAKATTIDVYLLDYVPLISL